MSYFLSLIVIIGYLLFICLFSVLAIVLSALDIELVEYEDYN